MPAIPESELLTLQSQTPHTAKITWYLALAPYGDACFTAQVNDGAIARGERDIVYGGDVGEGNVSAGMTLWVGSDPGKYDVGKVRIKSINVGTNTITVAENDDIAWEDELFLTCPGAQGFRELWGIIPRITEVGGVVTFFEDYDIEYANPLDDVLPPKANAGPPVCAFLGSGGYVDVSFVGDDSFTTEVGAGIESYAWDFADGVVQSGGADQEGTCEDPNVVRFSTPGFRYVSLMVTDDIALWNRTGTVYVPVWIFDDDNPPLSVEVLSQGAKPSWRLQVKAFQTDSAATEAFYDYPDGALVVLFTTTEYPDGSSDIGGYCFRENIRFVGWLDSETLTFDYQAGTCEFEALSHELVINQLPGFAYTLEDDADPDDWYKVNELNMDRALHAHLERRSTVNQVCHVETLAEGPQRPICIQAFPDAGVYDQAQQYLIDDAVCLMIADRQGCIRVRRDPQMMTTVERGAVPVVCSLVRGDWINDLDQIKPHRDRTGHYRIGGFDYDTPLLAEAPGVCPSQAEAAIYKEGYLNINQAELTFWAGQMWSKDNNPFPNVPLELKGYWPVFDPAFQEYLRLTTTDALGRNVWTDQRFIIRGVTFRDLVADGTTVTELALEMECPIGSGEDVEVPPPPEPLPPPPPPEVIPIPVPEPEVALIYDRHRVYRTSNWDAVIPTWTNITAGLVGWICSVECDFYDGIGAWAVTGDEGVYNADNANTVGLWRTDDVTANPVVWTLVFSQWKGEDDIPVFPPNLYCTGAGKLAWGQMRSILPVSAGVVLIAEHKWHGINPWHIGQATRIYQVTSAGVVSDARAACAGAWNNSWYPACGYCPEGAGANPGAYFWEQAYYVTQYDLRGCHQLMPWTDQLHCPIGMFIYMEDNFCVDEGECGGTDCNWRLPFPPPTPSNGWTTDWTDSQTLLGGARHGVWHKGRWWAITEDDETGGGSQGQVYCSYGVTWAQGVYGQYCFCNMCSTPNDIYWCQPQVGGENNLFENGVDTAVGSDYLFGPAVPGPVGIIGHIRTIWTEIPEVVLVRKNRNDQNLGVNGDRVVWTWDGSSLVDKTGNLGSGDWWGTGESSLVLAGYNYRFDNVGFTSFETPLR